MTAEKPNFQRVRHGKVCPICKHDSWCVLIPPDRVLCMRVQSNRPSSGQDGGWIHLLSDTAPRIPKVPVRPAPPSINATKMMLEFQANTNPEWIRNFSERLGVPYLALAAMECAWAAKYRAYAFPMKDAYGNYIGIRLRDWNGHKWAVPGSRNGLFIPLGNHVSHKTVYVVEGPTDAAAGYSIGLFTVGRPSCSGSVQEMFRLAKQQHCARAVLIADNDNPGVDGAEKLASQIGIPSAMICLPSKDLRDFVRGGGTRQLIESLVGCMVWHQP